VSTGIPSSEPSDRVAIGRYELEIGAAGGTRITPHTATGDATQLAQALEAEPRERLTPVATIERSVEAASEATRRATEATDLFRASVAGTLLEPELLPGRIDVMLELLQRLDREGHWEDELRLARAITKLLALAMRWAELVRSLGLARQAAERLDDSAGIAWAQHELGTLRLAANDPAGAELRLAEAQATRSQIGDSEGLAATEQNLGVLCRQLRELLREGRLGPGRRPPRRALLALVAVLLLLLGGVAGAVIDPFDGARAQLSARVAGPGTVTSRPAGISCPDRCERDFDRGARVLLTPKPSGQATFLGWSGACHGTSTCRLRLRRDRAVVAAFRKPSQPGTATLRVRAANGRVSSTPVGIDCGDRCVHAFQLGAHITLTAAADPGYGLNTWVGPCTGTGTCPLTMDGDRSVSADFRPQRTISVTVHTDPNTTGTVTSDPPGIHCSADTCTARFLANRDTVQLSATGDYSTFRWGGACASEMSTTCSLPLDANHQVTASFFGVE